MLTGNYVVLRSKGVEHLFEVTADSLYEPVAQALRVFREDEWSEDPVDMPLKN